MKLSKNFTLKEMTISETAAANGWDNTPKGEHLGALKALCQDLLQPIRDSLGVCLVTSGYRGETLNKAIGGSATSQHTKGEAADFTINGMNVYDTCVWIKDSGLDFDQMIYEKRGEVEWVHISYKRHGGNRKEVLTANYNSKTRKMEYVRGLLL